MENIFKINSKEYVLPGHRSCPGCGMSLAYRYVLKALGPNTLVTYPAGCLNVLHGLYPITAVPLPALGCTFASTAASAAGLVAGLKALKRTGLTVLAMAGDGGTFDIGLQALSGAVERRTDFIFACYDNEGYMNTGNQCSGATPLGALTSTTPETAKQESKKDMLRIMAAHDPPYLASTSAAYPIDLYQKFLKAKGIPGSRYIQIASPCVSGWGIASGETVRIGKLAVETGLVVLFEIEKGKLRLTGRSRILARKGGRLPVQRYVEKQGRFRAITPEQVEQLQQWTDGRWEEYTGRAER